ncbi:MAG: hypothetical protein Fur006_62450 [Coleofasciculaceae cyanobacterium]
MVRYSYGLVIQERAKRLLEALLTQAEELLRNGNSFEKSQIKVAPLNKGSNEPELELNVKRSLLASLIGLKTENLTFQDSKNVSDKLTNVIKCLEKFGAINSYSAKTSGWWKLTLPHENKTKLLAKLYDGCDSWNKTNKNTGLKLTTSIVPELSESEEAIAKPCQELGEAVKPSASTLSSNQRVDYTRLRELATEQRKIGKSLNFLLPNKRHQNAIAFVIKQTEELWLSS